MKNKLKEIHNNNDKAFLSFSPLNIYTNNFSLYLFLEIIYIYTNIFSYFWLSIKLIKQQILLMIPLNIFIDDKFV